jgi:hypothetical protein
MILRLYQHNSTGVAFSRSAGITWEGHADGRDWKTRKTSTTAFDF